jgi:multiple sugar transport system ATP-binding protein
MAAINFSNVSKTYGDGAYAVQELNLDIADGECMVLVGPSGCGKTTALRMVAGLETVSSGELSIGDTVVNALPPQKRDVAMVFQNYALYPHMSIFENIAFPLRSARIPKSEVRDRVERAAELLGLTEYLPRKPRTLSGGQRQRVAMGRAIVREPQAFLLDEPLSNLDAKLRGQMRFEIARLQEKLAVTTIYVTHDQVEAMTMGDRIAVMRKGVLQQVGRAEDLYERPRNIFVATFIGSPPMNLFRANLREEANGLSVQVGDQTLTLPLDTLAERPALLGYMDRQVALGIRAERLSDPAYASPDAPLLHATVTRVENLGLEKLVHADIAADALITEDLLEVARDIDAAAVQSLEQQSSTNRAPVVASFDHRSRPAASEHIAFAVDPAGIHFFDVDDGNEIRGEQPVASNSPSAIIGTRT